MDNPVPAGNSRALNAALKTLAYVGALIQETLPFAILGGLIYMGLTEGLGNHAEGLTRSLDQSFLGRTDGYRAGFNLSKFQFWQVNLVCRLHSL
jgi:hypothetical protein